MSGNALPPLHAPKHDKKRGNTMESINKKQAHDLAISYAAYVKSIHGSDNERVLWARILRNGQVDCGIEIVPNKHIENSELRYS